MRFENAFVVGVMVLSALMAMATLTGAMLEAFGGRFWWTLTFLFLSGCNWYTGTRLWRSWRQDP